MAHQWNLSVNFNCKSKVRSLLLLSNTFGVC
ncbi:hypothetical protein COLO4_32756 [Corchorus olitorius]|uniref:Uncharacterized protein n=1 Tax=Corchorus olitorius TaxID=93759 RepID=A0A1R3GYB2_9ROSI|nr:hypothetical protein COLO4_32756 [Corchorus olitorius]